MAAKFLMSTLRFTTTRASQVAACTRVIHLGRFQSVPVASNRNHQILCKPHLAEFKSCTHASALSPEEPTTTI
eukprot:5709606-Amphidinium_carterae.1